MRESSGLLGQLRKARTHRYVVVVVDLRLDATEPGKRAAVIGPLAWKAGEGRRRKDGCQGCLSELRELHGKESFMGHSRPAELGSGI
jgi:hypothetical protein